MQIIVSASAVGNPSPDVLPQPEMHNGDFLIQSNTPDQPVGDGTNEFTFWTFNIKEDPNYPFLDTSMDLDYIDLTIKIEPKQGGFETDSIRIVGLDGISVTSDEFGGIPIGSPSVVPIKLLRHYEYEDLKRFLQQGEIPMQYEEDAIISEARISIAQDPSREIHLESIQGIVNNPSVTIRNEWEAGVHVIVTDEENRGVQGAKITGHWSHASEEAECFTDHKGHGLIISPLIANNTQMVTFTVSDGQHRIHDFTFENFDVDLDGTVEFPRVEIHGPR